MTTVCNKPCKYRKAVFCGLTFTMLNQFGQCLVWFDRNGNMRMAPDYRYDAAPVQNHAGYSKDNHFDKISENPEKPKNDESKIENTEGDNETEE